MDKVTPWDLFVAAALVMEGRLGMVSDEARVASAIRMADKLMAERPREEAGK